tara:strand:- start:2034 stop:3650 length:1617 start_codon:yes stop_codon:yes gene_type:complete
MKKEYLVIILVLTIFAVVIEGYRFGEENHTNYFSLTKYKIDNSFYSEDFYIQNASLPGYFFEILMRGGGEYLEEISFFIYILSLYFLFFMIFKISHFLFKDKYVAYLSILLLFIPKNTMGWGHTRDYMLYYSLFVLPFLFLAIYLFLKKRYIWAFVIVGLSLNLHILTSIFVLAMFLFYFLINFRKIKKSSMVSSLGGFFICALPIFLRDSVGSIFPNELWLEVARLRVGHHFFPFTWSLSSWIPFILFVVLFIWAYQYRNFGREKYNKVILTFSFAIFIMLIFGIIFSEFIPIKPLILIQFFRSAPFFVIFALLYASNYIIGLIKKPQLSHNLLGIFLGGVLFYYSNLKILMGVLGLGLILFLIVRKFKKNKNIEKMIMFGTLSFLIIMSIGAITWKGLDHVNLPWVEDSSAWQNIRIWSKENTPKDSLFVTRLDKNFRFYSERSVFITGKDMGLGAVLNPRGDELIPEYLKRFNLIGCDYLKDELVECIEKYNLLNEEKILKIKEEYGIDYIIFDKPKELEFEIAYENNRFIIYVL